VVTRCRAMGIYNLGKGQGGLKEQGTQKK